MPSCVNEHRLYKRKWKSRQISRNLGIIVFFSCASSINVSDEEEPASLTPTPQSSLYKANLANQILVEGTCPELNPKDNQPESSGKFCGYRITESQNGRGWKGPLWVTQSNLLLKKAHLQQAAQDLVQVGLGYLQRRRLHPLPGQPVPGLCHPQSEEVLPQNYSVIYWTHTVFGKNKILVAPYAPSG